MAPGPDSANQAWLLLALTAAVTLTLFLRGWFSIGPGDAGVWGVENTRWDDTHLDLDIWFGGYLAFAAGLVAVVLSGLAGVAMLKGARAPVARARTAMIVTLCGMMLFLIRFYMEGSPDIGWAGIVGPTAAIGAIVILSRLITARSRAGGGAEIG